VILLSVAYVDNSTIPQTYELQSQKERPKIHNDKDREYGTAYIRWERNFNLVEIK